MNRMSTVRSRVPGVGLGGDRSTTARVVTALLLAALLVPLLMALFAPSAMADDEEDNYSMYKLASNAAGYFSEAREPGSSLAEPWPDIAASQPGAAGSLMGYGDANVSEFARWMTAGMSGSTQTISYDTLRSQGEEGGQSFDAMLTYAEFGAANRDLGLDSMSSSIMGDIMNKFSGSIVYFFYAMALLVSVLFWLVIQFLQILNPFMWFYQAIHAINPTFAEGMVGGTPPGDSGLWSEGGALAGLSNFVSEWYSLIYEMAWQAMVPLFVGVLLISLVLFKKMDRGSAIKKLVVRVVFIGVGLPLLGSLYTGVLDKFDDSLMGQHSGPTRVVLSTYVDFDAWAMNGRLHIPDEASIGWNEKKGQADPSSQMSVRTTALAINAQSHSVLNDMNVGTERSDATSAWEDGSAVSMSGTGDSVGQVVTTFGILNRFISGAETTASDFESGIKGNLSETVEDSELKEKWFIKKDTYGDVEEFGIEGDPMAADAPMISTNGAGLQGTVDGSGYRQFTSTGTTNCGFKVHSEGDPIPCNLSPLSMYNYLNSSFSADSMTAYSSENAMSGLVRETHSSVSQVGTGPAAVMFWANTVTILGSLVILGVWYAVGMVVASFRRTFGILAATPFATLGAIGAISKVIIYSIALILELVVTLFLYQFVSELLISVPGILAGPVSNVMSEDGLLGSYLLGSVVVVALTFVSTVIILGITFALLRIRKQVLQAMDEVVTKLVDKFMDTNTAPKGDKGGMMPALASGLGAGAGMAAGNKIANGFNRGGGGPAKSPGGQGGPKDSGGFSNSTNAGGLNPRAALAAGQGGDPKLLEAGKGDGSAGEGPDGPGGTGTGGGGGDTREISPGGSPLGLPPGKDGQDGHNQGQDSPTAPGSGGSGTGASDKETAQRLSANGGLSNLGYNSEGSRGSQAVGGGRGESIPGELVGPSGEGVKGDQNSGQGLPGQNGQPGHRGGGMKGQGLGEGTSFGTGAHAQSGTNAEGTTPNGNVPEPGTKLAGKSNVAPLSEPGTNFGTGQHPQAGQQAESTAMPSSSKSGAAVVGGQSTSFGTGAHAQSGTNAEGTAQNDNGSEPGTNFGTGQHPPAGQQTESSPKSGLVVGGQGTSFGNGTGGQSGPGQGQIGQGQQGTQSSQDASGPIQPGQRGLSVTGAGSAPTQFGGVSDGASPSGALPLNQVPLTGKSNHIMAGSGESPQQVQKAKASAEGWRQTPQGWVPPTPASGQPPAQGGAPSAPNRSHGAPPQAAVGQPAASRFTGGQQTPATNVAPTRGDGFAAGTAQPSSPASTTITPGGRSPSGAMVVPPPGGMPSGGQTIHQRFTPQGVQDGRGDAPTARPPAPAQGAPAPQAAVGQPGASRFTGGQQTPASTAVIPGGRGSQGGQAGVPVSRQQGPARPTPQTPAAPRTPPTQVPAQPKQPKTAPGPTSQPTPRTGKSVAQGTSPAPKRAPKAPATPPSPKRGSDQRRQHPKPRRKG